MTNYSAAQIIAERSTADAEHAGIIFALLAIADSLEIMVNASDSAADHVAKAIEGIDL